MTAQTHYMGVPVQSFSEPSQAEKRANREQIRKAIEAEQLAARTARSFVLAPGTPITTDIYGFRGHAAQVVRDDGPAEASNRKVQIRKISGRNAGEEATVSRDRLKVTPA